MAYQRRLSIEDMGAPVRPRVRPPAMPSVGGGDGDLGTLLNAYAQSQNPAPGTLSPYFGLEGALGEAIQNQILPPANANLDPAYQQLRGIENQEDQFNRTLAAQERMGQAQLGSQERVAGIEAQGRAGARGIPTFGDLIRLMELGDQAKANSLLGRAFAGESQGAPLQPGFGAVAPGQSSAAPTGSGASAAGVGPMEPWQALQQAARTGGVDPSVVGRTLAKAPNIFQPPVPLARQEAEAGAKTYGAETAKGNAEHEANVLGGGASAQERLQSLQVLEQQLAKAPQGWSSPIAGAWGQALSLAGVPPATVDAITGAPSMEAAQSTIMNTLLRMMEKPTGETGSFGTGFSNEDRKAMMQRLPALANTPGGNQQILAVLKRDAELGVAKADAFRQLQEQRGGGMVKRAEFDKHWNELRKGGNAFVDIFEPDTYAQMVEILRQRPDTAPMFDRRTYPGASAKVLGGK